jgi:hypothetical protein
MGGGQSKEERCITTTAADSVQVPAPPPMPPFFSRPLPPHSQSRPPSPSLARAAASSGSCSISLTCWSIALTSLLKRRHLQPVSCPPPPPSLARAAGRARTGICSVALTSVLKHPYLQLVPCSYGRSKAARGSCKPFSARAHLSLMSLPHKVTRSAPILLPNDCRVPGVWLPAATYL